MKDLFDWLFRALVVAFVGGAPAVLIVALAQIQGCPRMREQPRLKPYQQSDFFDDRRSVRHPPAGTIPRGEVFDDPALRYGRKTLPGLDAKKPGQPVGPGPVGGVISPGDQPAQMPAQPGEDKAEPMPQQPAPPTPDGQTDYVTSFPIPVTKTVLEQGQKYYNAYCSPCHSVAGNGNGPVTYNGFPNPPSFHTQRLRSVEVGYIYEVISKGFGLMYSYAGRLQPAERWATVAYVRALQLSQHAPARLLEAEDRQQLEEGPP